MRQKPGIWTFSIIHFYLNWKRKNHEFKVKNEQGDKEVLCVNSTHEYSFHRKYTIETCYCFPYFCHCSLWWVSSLYLVPYIKIFNFSWPHFFNNLQTGFPFVIFSLWYEMWMYKTKSCCSHLPYHDLAWYVTACFIKYEKKKHTDINVKWNHEKHLWFRSHCAGIPCWLIIKLYA